MKKKNRARRQFRETALMRLGSQVSRFAVAPVGGVDVVADITDRLMQADGDLLAPAWAEVVGRSLRLERVPQSHRTRASLRWLRRWEVWIGEEMNRREAVPPSASRARAAATPPPPPPLVLVDVATVTAEFDVGLALQRAEERRTALLGAMRSTVVWNESSADEVEES